MALSASKLSDAALAVKTAWCRNDIGTIEPDDIATLFFAADRIARLEAALIEERARYLDAITHGSVHDAARLFMHQARKELVQQGMLAPAEE